MFYFSKKIEILVYTYTVAWSMGPAEKQNIHFTNIATNKFFFHSIFKKLDYCRLNTQKSFIFKLSGTFF